MAFVSLADEWLRSNDPTIGKAEARHARRKLRHREVPHFYCEHDRKAYETLISTEKNHKPTLKVTVRGKRVKKHVGAPPLSGVAFLQIARKTQKAPYCIFMPFADLETPAAVEYCGKWEPAARVMCRFANGSPPGPESVARHLCGNGHLSCVNPLHLVWGSQEENARDRELHRGWPRQRVCVDEATRADIVADVAHPNVTAIRLQIPSIVIMMIKAGTYI
jgi:hypothetical protein